MNIKALELFTRDLDKAEAFYGGVLGFKIIDKREDSITFKAGLSKLTFNRTDIQKPFYHFAFNIPSNKVEEALQWLRDKVQILPFSEGSIIADYVNWNAKAIYFLDTAGNIVEFIARFDLGVSTDKPFNASSITEISEIGLVVDDVFIKSEKITAKYNLPIFAKQPRLKSFAAIGDDHGLFIVVDKQKNWAPTDIRAQSFPLTATIVCEGETFIFKVNEGQ